MQGSLTDLFTQNSVINSSLKKQFKNVILLSGISFALISCGGGSGGGGLPAKPEAIGKVQGTAFIGAVSDGDVNIYEFKAGERGQSLANTSIKTGDDGAYSIDLQTSSKSILVCLSNASYRETTSGQKVNFLPEQELCAIENYITGDTFDISITYYSHVSAGLATRLLDFNVDSTNAVNDSNEEIKRWVGYNINTVVPVNILNRYDAASLDDPLQAGFATAAISVYTGWVNGVSGIGPNNPERHKIFNSILFAQRAYQDIVADGALDGRSNLGPTGLGAVPLSVNTYRGFIALDMIVLTKSSINKTDIKDPQAIYPTALAYSNFDRDASTSPTPSILNIFGKSEAGGPLAAASKPFLKNFIVPKVITGDVKIVASVVDFLNEVTTVEFYITNDTLPGKTLGTILNERFGLSIAGTDDIVRPAAILSTIVNDIPSLVDDKNYKIQIFAKDSTGAVVAKSKQLGAIIGNTGTQLEGLSPTTQFLKADGTPVNATEVLQPSNFVTGKFNLYAGVSNPLGVSSVDLVIDGLLNVPVGNFNATNNPKYAVPIYRLNTLTVNAGVALTDGSHEFVLTVVGDVNGANQSLEKRFKYNVDNTPPRITTTAPTSTLPSGWFTSDFNIGINVSDDTVPGVIGSGINNVKIVFDGALRDTVTVITPETLVERPFTISQIPDGNHIVRVQTTDNVGLTTYETNSIIIKTDSNAPTLTITPTTLQIYTLPTECNINVSAADPVGQSGGIGSGVKNVVINNVVKGAVTTPFQFSLQSLITVGVGVAPAVVPQVVNFTATVEDVAGQITTKAITLTATQPTANNYTCQIVVN